MIAENKAIDFLKFIDPPKSSEVPPLRLIVFNYPQKKALQEMICGKDAKVFVDAANLGVIGHGKVKLPFSLRNCLFLWVFLAFSAHARLLRESLPQTISIVVSGKGDAWTSSFGHIDFLLSYQRGFHTGDVLVGFGPPSNEQLTFARAMGWTHNPYPMQMWKSTFLSRIQEALQIRREWIKVAPLKLTQLEKRNLVNEIENTNAQIRSIFYVATSRNCSTLVAKILSQVKEQKIKQPARHQPFAALALYKKFHWIEKVHTFQPEDLRAVLRY